MYGIDRNEPKEINNENEDKQLFNSYIHRIGNSDTWECDKCLLKRDIHFMKQHICIKN